MTTPAKKPRSPKRTLRKKPIAVLETKTMPLADLTMHHKNPRVGDVDAIAESLRESGQYKAIIVNKGTKTGRPYEILGGNHTYLAMKRIGEKEMLVSLVDVSETEATKILLSDNKTAEKGTYDDEALKELFASLPDAVGTGYSQEELDAVVKEAQEAATTVLAGLEEEEAEQAEQKQSETFDGTGLGDDDEDDDDDGYVFSEKEEPGSPEITKQSDELSGLAELKEDLPEDPKYRVGYWQLPALRKDMLMTSADVNDNLESWAGSATKDWPVDDQWWLYNWGVDSTSGMKDVSKVIVSFYCWDDYFENWFWGPKRYVTKLLNSKIKYMVTPNYSMWSNVSRFMNVWALYRSRYVGRYAQEAGIKVVPDLIWPTGDKELLEKFILPTLPHKIPMIAHQLQTNSGQLIAEDGTDATSVAQKNYKDEFQLALDTLEPEAILFYTTEHGLKWFNDNIRYTGEVIYVETRMRKLADSRKGKEKKATI